MQQRARTARESSLGGVADYRTSDCVNACYARLRQSPNALAGWLLFGCASDKGLLRSLLRAAGADWLLSGSASDCELLRSLWSLWRTARLLLCHLHTNMHQLLPHNTTCLRSPHNAMHSPSYSPTCFTIHFSDTLTIAHTLT